MERKLDQLLQQQSHFSQPSVMEEPYIEDSGKPFTIAIEKMSSTKPEIREQVNAIRCLQDLGFPLK